MGGIRSALAVCMIAGAGVSQEAAVAHEPVVVAPGEGRLVDVPFHESRLLLSESSSEGGVSIYEFVVEPHSGGAPPHTHTHEDEYAYILDGTLNLMLGDQIVEADPGTVAALTRGNLHAFWNASDRPVRALFLVSQGGFEGFFDAVATSLRERPPEGPSEANSRIGEIAAAHGIELRPDLIPEDVRHLYAP